jgi:hypothetical protein
VIRAVGTLGLAAAFVLSGCSFTVDDGESGPPMTIDEHAGTYAGVGFGSTAADVRAVFGPASAGDGPAPLGEAWRGPEFIPFPGRAAYTTLNYEEATFFVTAERGVYWFMTTNDGDATRAGVHVGDPLALVRERYDRVACGSTFAGEPLFRPDPPRYPWCRARVGAVEVFFGDDPIEAISLRRVR